MDDFNGTFCKNGTFPVVSAVSNCFKRSFGMNNIRSTPSTTITTETSTLTTRALGNDSKLIQTSKPFINKTKRPVIVMKPNDYDKTIFDFDEHDWLMLNKKYSSFAAEHSKCNYLIVLGLGLVNLLWKTLY